MTSVWHRVEDKLPDVHREPATPDAAGATTPDEANQSRAVLVKQAGAMRLKMPSGLFVAHYDWKQKSWLLSADNRYGMLFPNYVTHWRELPEGPA